MLVLNGSKVETGLFPNNESWVEIGGLVEVKPYNAIEMKFETNDDIVNLIQLKGYLDSLHVETRLIIRYFPYSRMDRINKHYAFALKYICNVINSLNFYQVRITEPHSDVVCALLDRVIIEDWIVEKLNEICDAIGFTENSLICYPDQGALKRYTKDIDRPSCFVNKLRDFKTGKIVKFDLVHSHDSADKVLIVDDLCSRGGTFIGISSRIKEVFGSETKVYLAVAHCEPNVYTGDLLKGNVIERLFTTSSIIRDESNKITVLN